MRYQTVCCLEIALFVIVVQGVHKDCKAFKGLIYAGNRRGVVFEYLK